MVRSSGVLMVAMVSLAGCFNPDDIFPLTGRVESIDPVEGQVVRLLRQNAVGMCDLGQASAFKEATVDGGFFGFEVFRAEAQRLTDQGGFCFWAETTFPSGSMATGDQSNISGLTDLGVLRDWRANPRLDGGVLEFDPPIPPTAPTDPNSDRSPSLYQRATILSADGGTLWRADDQYLQSADDTGDGGSQPIIVDDLRLEDFAGVLTLTAQIYEPGDPNSLLYSPGASTTLRSGQTLTVRGGQAPLSRGLPCPMVATPCPLTDGDVTPVAVSTSELRFELPQPTVLRGVVLRNVVVVTPTVLIDLVAEDGGESQLTQALMPSVTDVSLNPGEYLFDGGYDFPNGMSFFTVIALDAGVPTSSVRLTFGGLTQAGEISLVGP